MNSIFSPSSVPAFKDPANSSFASYATSHPETVIGMATDLIEVARMVGAFALCALLGASMLGAKPNRAR